MRSLVQWRRKYIHRLQSNFSYVPKINFINCYKAYLLEILKKLSNLLTQRRQSKCSIRVGSHDDTRMRYTHRKLVVNTHFTSIVMTEFTWRYRGVYDDCFLCSFVKKLRNTFVYEGGTFITKRNVSIHISAIIWQKFAVYCIISVDLLLYDFNFPNVRRRVLFMFCNFIQ